MSLPRWQGKSKSATVESDVESEHLRLAKNKKFGALLNSFVRLREDPQEIRSQITAREKWCDYLSRCFKDGPLKADPKATQAIKALALLKNEVIDESFPGVMQTKINNFIKTYGSQPAAAAEERKTPGPGVRK